MLCITFLWHFSFIHCCFGSLILTVHTITMPVMDMIYSKGIIVDSWGLSVTMETNLQVKRMGDLHYNTKFLLCVL